mgnify:FL=1|jgi:hypothetical protein|tara:strand:- start:8757 stop:8957 length:201 start_codon:yes stop_codon:yes gene_type:complete
MKLDKIKVKLGATRPTKIQYESVRADIELELTMDDETFAEDWKRIRNKAKIMLLEAMADAERGMGR